MLKRKNVIQTTLLFLLYVAFAYVSVFPGYYSPVYWTLFPIVAGFLMAGPLTVMMLRKRMSGTAAMFPVALFILAKLMGEMKFTCVWIPFLLIAIAAENVHCHLDPQKLLSIRVSVPLSLLTMAMWNNGFYFGGEAYLSAGIEDMGAEYIAAACRMATPFTYIAVLAGVFLAAMLSERLTEKITKISQ